MWTEAADREGRRPGGREGGFALALVVLMLFAVGLAGAVGYQVIMAEARMALQSHESAQALAIARAGLQLYMGEQVGPLPDTVRYPMNDGEATVTARRLWNAFDDDGTPDHLYLITSVGSFSDPRYATTAAERTVHQYVVQRRLPMNQLGALVVLDGTVVVKDGAMVDGRDQSGNNDCLEARGPDIAGVVTVETEPTIGGIIPTITLGTPPTIERNNNVRGTPQTYTYATYDEAKAALDTRWDLLTDSDFPVEYDDTWPTSFPADSFRVIRWSGDLDVGAGQSGRGVLIVEGVVRVEASWLWEGVVLARDFTDVRSDASVSYTSWELNGLVVTGLGDQSEEPVVIKDNGEIIYYLCEVLDGGDELAHLEPLGGTWWEAY